MPKISGYVKTFKVNEKVDKLCLLIEIMRSYYRNTIWSKIEDLKK